MENIIWGAEFSHKQKCFHLDGLDRILEMNRRTILRGNGNDYLVFFTGTAEECSKEITKMQKLLEEQGVLKRREENIDN